METTLSQKEQLIELYIATFDRAPDFDGFTYWLANITTNGWSIEDVAKSMFDSKEVEDNYPSTLSNSDYIDKIYNNVLNRYADDAGKSYWVKQMDDGAISKDQMLLAVINGANADTGSETDKQILENKKEAGSYFTITHQLNDINLAKSIMEPITADVLTVEQAKDAVDISTYSQVPTNIIIEGTDANDIITSTVDSNFIYTYAGDDLITTLNGTNRVVSGSGVDSIYTGIDNDIIYTRDGNDTVYARAGDDAIYGEGGDDSLHGEDGNDVIYGGDGNDYLYGDAGDDRIIADAGDDYIYGGLGNDALYANDGDDFVSTGSGVNFVDGGSGNDMLYGGDFTDTIYGGAGNDTIYGNNGDDILDGLLGDDIIYAGFGNDTIDGNEGQDILYGSDGNDKIDGEMGDDFIDGGLGSDELIGGAGIDTFSIKSKESTLTSLDMIVDFTYFTDKLILQNQGDESISKSRLDVSSSNTLASAVDAASTGDGSSNAIVQWFVYDDFTYIVEDLNKDAVFNNDTDILIKLQGIIALDGLDASTITFN